MTPIQALLSRLIDYAGLFPPAGLDMKPAIVEYERWLKSEFEWMVGSFVCPVSRFEDLANAATNSTIDHIAISALPGPDLDAELDAIADFIDRHDDQFSVPTLEWKVSSAAPIDEALDLLDADEPEHQVFFEVPLNVDFRGMIAAIAGSGHGAKIRTGGITADLYPSAATIAAFIVACRDARVPFKATAGLHHPTRRPVPNLGVTMYGFFNVFLAATVAASVEDTTVADIEHLLLLDGSDWFTFTDTGIELENISLSTDEIDRAREIFACSFGSCSIAEPVEDLQALSLLPASTTS